MNTAIKTWSKVRCVRFLFQHGWNNTEALMNWSIELLRAQVGYKIEQEKVYPPAVPGYVPISYPSNIPNPSNIPFRPLAVKHKKVKKKDIRYSLPVPRNAEKICACCENWNSFMGSCQTGIPELRKKPPNALATCNMWAFDEFLNEEVEKKDNSSHLRKNVKLKRIPGLFGNVGKKKR